MAVGTGGLLDGARDIAGDGVRILRTRLELLAVEVQAEKALIVRQLVVSAAVLFLVSFGTLLVILWLVLSLPEVDRQVALLGVGLAFLLFAAGGVAWLAFGRQKHALLSSSIAVLKGDEAALRQSRG